MTIRDFLQKRKAKRTLSKKDKMGKDKIKEKKEQQQKLEEQGEAAEINPDSKRKGLAIKKKSSTQKSHTAKKGRTIRQETVFGVDKSSCNGKESE